MYPSYSPLFTLGLLADSSSIPDDTSPIYFTFQAGKRDSIELRSFLYLDLADGRHSHRRKHSALSKSISWSCSTSPRSEKPAVPPVPTRRRTSKESLRTIPSPKPAPSATLPDVPEPSSPKKRPASTVVSSLLSPTRFRRPASLRAESISSKSISSKSISSSSRRRSRLDALACLEGRSTAPNRIHRPSSLRKNFMSFSDDEDDKSPTHKPCASAPCKMSHADDHSAFADVEDEADAIVPGPRKRGTARVIPARPAKPARKRRGTIESWFPLKSFIDLKDDDLSSWNWRSFIEIGGVA